MLIKCIAELSFGQEFVSGGVQFRIVSKPEDCIEEGYVLAVSLSNWVVVSFIKTRDVSIKLKP